MTRGDTLNVQDLGDSDLQSEELSELQALAMERGLWAARDWILARLDAGADDVPTVTGPTEPTFTRTWDGSYVGVWPDSISVDGPHPLAEPKEEDDEDPIDHWNYRVFYQKSDSGLIDGEFSIRDAYYDKKGRVVAWSGEPMAPYGETDLELEGDLLLMLDALEKPVVKISKGGNKLRGKEGKRAKKAPHPRQEAEDGVIPPFFGSGTVEIADGDIVPDVPPTSLGVFLAESENVAKGPRG